MMYSEGEAVAQDKQQAALWLGIAARGFDDPGARAAAAQQRDAILAGLSAKDRDVLERQQDQWRPRLIAAPIQVNVPRDPALATEQHPSAPRDSADAAPEPCRSSLRDSLGQSGQWSGAKTACR